MKKVALFIESFEHVKSNEFYINAFCKKLFETARVETFEIYPDPSTKISTRQNEIKASFSSSYDVIISFIRLRVFEANRFFFSEIFSSLSESLDFLVTLPTPSLVRTKSSISSAIFGFSRRYVLVFSLPCPILLPLKA